MTRWFISCHPSANVKTSVATPPSRASAPKVGGASTQASACSTGAWPHPSQQTCKKKEIGCEEKVKHPGNFQNKSPVFGEIVFKSP